MANAPDPGQSSSPDGPGADASQSEVEADIARTRADLGYTVEQLAEKLDVKAQAQHKVDDIKHNATDAVDDVRHKATDAIAAAKAKMSSAGPGGRSSNGRDSATEASSTQASVTVPGHRVRVAPGGPAVGPSPDWARAAPLAITSGVLLVAAIIVLVWRQR